jgi:putative membrane protein
MVVPASRTLVTWPHRIPRCVTALLAFSEAALRAEAVAETLGAGTACAVPAGRSGASAHAPTYAIICAGPAGPAPRSARSPTAGPSRPAALAAGRDTPKEPTIPPPMIVRPRLPWLRMLFVIRGSVLPDILPQLILTAAFATIVTVLHGMLFRWKVPLNFVPFSLIGITLAIFLGFRNSTSYARYWEARVLWGAVLNETRSLARQATSFSTDASTVPLFVHRLIAFAHALRHQLRNTDPEADLRRVLRPDDCARLAAMRYKPAVLLQMAGEWIGARHRDGTLPDVAVQAMENPMCQLSAALGGCERIANTPIPYTYAVILHRTVYLYCFLLPFGLVDAIGLTTPLVVAFIAYTFFALEALSSEIEEPFGTEPNDLALNAMSVGIEATLRETIGEPITVSVKVSDDYVLV